MEDDAFNYDGLLQANLKRIFSEPDAGRREAAIGELYEPDAALYEPGHIATGHFEIARAVEGLVTRFPPGFTFAPDGPAVGHHGMARLRWRGMSTDGVVVVSGTDVVQIEQGRIGTIHVFIDPAPV